MVTRSLLPDCNLLILNIMLLTIALLTSAHTACHADGMLWEQKSCRTSSVESLARRNEFYQNNVLQDSVFKQLSHESLQKVETLQNDSAFQETVKVLQSNSSQSHAENSSPKAQSNLFDTNLNEASLFIFVSFSMGEKALLNIAHEAKRFGATLVLRGFRDASYLKTAQTLQNMIIKTGQGVLIDPELYALFYITAVPTFVLAKPFSLQAQVRIQTPIHDKLQGHVSPRYALEIFAKEGDLKREAQLLLKMSTMP